MSPTAADFLRSTLALSTNGRLSMVNAFSEATFGHPPMDRAVNQAAVYLHDAADELGLDLADALDADERQRVVARALALAEAR